MTEASQGHMTADSAAVTATAVITESPASAPQTALRRRLRPDQSPESRLLAIGAVWQLPTIQGTQAKPATPPQTADGGKSQCHIKHIPINLPRNLCNVSQTPRYCVFCYLDQNGGDIDLPMGGGSLGQLSSVLPVTL